jgi:hypothetical protein
MTAKLRSTRSATLGVSGRARQRLRSGSPRRPARPISIATALWPTVIPRPIRSSAWFGGALTPKPYNEQEAQKRAMESLPTLERKTQQLLKDSHDVGIGDPPQQVLEDLKWLVRIDHEVHPDQSWAERWHALVKLFDERYGTHYSNIPTRTEGEAEAAYHQLRPLLYPNYAEWQHAVNQAIDQRLEAQPAAVG